MEVDFGKTVTGSDSFEGDLKEFVLKNKTRFVSGFNVRN